MQLQGLRVAVYGRYSTDKQNPRSVDDQVRACRARVAALGGVVAEDLVFADAAVSGSSFARPGLDALQAAVRDRRVDVVVVEDLSRIGRDQIGTLGVLRTLRTHGAQLLALDGFDTSQSHAKLIGALKSVMGEMYLDELRDRTKRGMGALFDAGMATGGRAYGYKSVDAGDGSGRSKLAIDEQEAAIVKRIFALHVAGAGQREIARTLNSDGVPSARGGKWAHLTVRSLIRNELYAGVVVFGRRDWKRTDDGKRRPVERPRSEWRRREHPELRIIDAETWHAAQARSNETARVHKSGARPKRGHPLSGLLACGACGALMTVTAGGRYYTCSGHKKGHGCDNAASLQEPAIRAWLCEGMADAIGAPAVLERLRAGLAASIGSHDRDVRRELAERRATLARIEGKCSKLIDLATDGHDSPSLRAKLADEESNAELQRAAIIALEQRLGRVPVLPSAAQVVDFLRRLPELIARRPDAGRELLGRLLDGAAVVSPPAVRGEAFHVRARLLPSEVLAHTASLQGAVYARVGCGGRISPLAYTESIVLEGPVRNVDRRNAQRPASKRADGA